MTKRKSIIFFVTAMLMVALLRPSGTAFSGEAAYPRRSIELICAFAAGGGADAVARIMAKYLSMQLGVPINVVNKTGGNQIPAVLSLLNARPDGYTLLMDQNGTSSMHAIAKDLPYKLEDRTYGPMMVEGPMVVVVNGKSPWNSLKDVVEAAKKDPSSFTWPNLGGTSNTEMTMFQLMLAGGVDIGKTKPVGFTGAGPADVAVAGNHIMISADGSSGVVPLISSGSLKPLGVTGSQRLSILPNVPTAKEAGFPSVHVVTWFALSGPKGLPKTILDRLDEAAQKVVKEAGFAKDVEAAGRYPVYMSPEQTREFVFKEAAIYKDFFSKPEIQRFIGGK